MRRMHGLRDLPTIDERPLSADVAAVIAQLRQRLDLKDQEIEL
jgi:hypothetical protein